MKNYWLIVIIIIAVLVGSVLLFPSSSDNPNANPFTNIPVLGVVLQPFVDLANAVLTPFKSALNSGESILADLQRELYKITHNGQSPPLDRIIATCTVTLKNNIAANVQLAATPVCIYSEPVDVYSCNAAKLKAGFLEDTGSVEMYVLYDDIEIATDKKLLETQSYSGFSEFTTKELTFKQCVEMRSNYLLFRLNDLHHNIIDEAGVPLFFTKLD